MPPTSMLFHTIALIVSCILVGNVCAADNPKPSRLQAWGGTGTIGVVSWPGLEEIEPAGAGSFDSLGYALEFAIYRNMARWGSADVLVGGDFSIYGTSSDVAGTSEDIIQRGLYLTPSVKLRFGERNGLYMNLAAGLGWYKVDLAELDCSDSRICSETAEQFDKDTVGGYLGISGGFFRWLIVDFKTHYADFGNVTQIDQEKVSLKGPIYMLSLGFAFGG